MYLQEDEPMPDASVSTRGRPATRPPRGVPSTSRPRGPAPANARGTWSRNTRGFRARSPVGFGRGNGRGSAHMDTDSMDVDVVRPSLVQISFTFCEIHAYAPTSLSASPRDPKANRVWTSSKHVCQSC